MSTLNYRSDIDGLRAIAVVSVLLYHLGFEKFSGGFVGVDVFFVISGYLITLLIKKEVDETGGFKYFDFYVKRARRLLPSLIFTLILCLIVAPIIFSPSHLEAFGASFVHTLASLSNVYFWTDSGYFDLAVEVKPLLHTWSLSVEEQFYFLWPLLIVFLLGLNNRVYVQLVLWGILAASLLLNFEFANGQSGFSEILPDAIGDLFLDGRSTIYYLTPFRVFELVIGALLVWCSCERIKVSGLANFLFVVGLIGITYPVFAYDENTLFPSYNALMPCVGTALVILSGKNASLSFILKNRVFIGIGLISYSLYLIHWPIIVFYKYWAFGNLGLVSKILLGLISIILAMIMYKYIEQPFRHKRSGDVDGSERFVFSVAVSLVLLVLPASNIWANNGWVWRLGGEVSKLYEEFGYGDDFVSKYAGGSNCPYKYSKDLGPTCETNIYGSKHVWIIGDSHGRHLTQGLQKYFKAVNFRFIKNNCRLNTLGYCYDIDDSIEKVHAEKKKNILDLVGEDNAPIIIAQTWIQRNQTYVDINTGERRNFNDVEGYASFVVKELDEVRKYFQKKSPGRRILVVGDVARPGLPDGSSPLECSLVPVRNSENSCDTRKIDSEYSRYKFNAFLEARFSKVTKDSILFVNPVSATCKDFICQNYIDGKYPVYMDNSHLSLWGSVLVVKELYPRIRYALRDYMFDKNAYAKK